MATLVLSAVGGIVGGPIGQAVGAIIGQAIDRDIVFKPKGREGPRLTELAVQTSSYGTPIQRVFGTMRIAGCVIWSTDLIESRSTSRSGKGQPSVTNYSYSASFAVALSGRPILDVGRIWADGKLLRGAGGDFKSATGFRLHTGGEDQPADPLIASAEGGLAPAHRGIAYAMFEHLQLADFGNRIPSLTFEVIADPGPVAVGAIAADVSDGLVRGEGATLPGFAAYGDARAVIETLAAAAGGRFVGGGEAIVMTADDAPDRMIGDDGFAASGKSVPRSRSVAAIETVPRTVTVAHYDPARDYQTGLQRARRPGAGTREDRVEMPTALSADAAKTIAEAVLARREAARERRTVALGWADLAIVPGACVTIADGAGLWRVTGWTLEHMVLTLDCVRLAAATAPATASPGRSLAAADDIAGPTILHAFETPALDDAVLGSPRLTIAAAGAPGWRGAALLYSTDGGARWTAAGATGAPATIGVLASLPGAGPASVIDRVNHVDVELAHAGMALTSADQRAIDAGVNLALVGDELLQFGVAAQIGDRRWRLSALWRGRRGTEAAIGRQAVGDRFVLIEPDAVATIDLPLAALGTMVRVIASGVGDVAGPASAELMLRGASVLPPAPVLLRAGAAGGGDVAVHWVRRSRAGWRWIDGADAPLGEEREAYRVTLRPAGGAARTIETAGPAITIAAGDLAGGCAVAVRQAGSHGESPAATIDL